MAPVALITGGTKGIGRSTAIGLAQKGYDVALSYSSSTKDFDITKEEIAKVAEVKVEGFQGDLSKEEEIKKLAEDVIKAFGRVDVLINNAGIAIYKPFLQATAEDLDKTHALNFKAPFLLTQALVPHMNKGSKIIFISSTLTTSNNIDDPYSVYVPSKGAIEQLMRVLSKNLAKTKGIIVNAVSPGPTGTELFLNGKSDEVIKHISSLSPYNRIGQPEEVAEIVVALSTGCNWVAGQNIRANGAFVV